MTEIPLIAENPQINERLWQAWTYKNRKLDKAHARMMRKLLWTAIGIAVLAAVFRDFLR